MDNRIVFLDYLRGMAMISVLLLHAAPPYREWLLAFLMPLFFILSGYTAYRIGNVCRVDFGTYIKVKCRRLLMPYLMFSLVNLFLYIGLSFTGLTAKNESFSFFSALFSIVSGMDSAAYTDIFGRLWFLPCIFWCSILLWVFLHCLQKNEKVRQNIFLAALVPVTFAVAWLCNHVLPFRLPLSLDTAITAFGFTLIGYAGGEKIKWLLKSRHTAMEILLFLGALAGLFVLQHSGKAEMHMSVNMYGEYPCSILCAICGAAAFLILTKWLYFLIRKIKICFDFITWYGRNSLTVFPVHLELKWFLIYFFGSFNQNRWYYIFAATVLLTVPFVNFAEHYMPFMLGKGYKRKRKTEKIQKNS